MAALTLRVASYTAATKTGTGASGSTTLTLSPDAFGIVVGHKVSGTGIGTGAVVQSVSFVSSTVTLSVANSGVVNGQVTFSESTKSAPLTNLEIDANFTELRRDVASKASLENPTLSNVTVSSGSINDTSVGATTRSTGAFTTLAANGATTLTAGTASSSTTTGTLVVTGGVGVSGAVHASSFNGSGAGLTNIPNAALVNSSITIAGTAVPLGGSISVVTPSDIGSSVQAYNATLAAVAGGTYSGDDSITTLGTIATGTWQGTAVGVGYGGTGASDAATARSNLGLAIGTNVQAYNATLAAVAGGTYSGDDSITTLGTIATGTWQGTAVGVGYGGTGATDASTARSNLGLAIGTNVQAYNATLAAVAGGTYTGATSITTLGTIATGTWQGTTVGVVYGGTGIASYAVGDILYASAATTLSKLNAAAAGNALLSGTSPSWGKIGLTTHISGTLAVGNGGTGATTLSGIIKGNGTSAFTAATAGTDYVTPSGTETLTNKTIGLAGTLDTNNNNITEIKTATFNSQAVLATTTGAVTIDWSAAQNYIQNEPTGAITYTFTAPPGVCHLQLVIDSDGTSTAQTITWPASVIWFGSAQWAGVNNKRAIINFWYNGTNYFAMGSNQV